MIAERRPRVCVIVATFNRAHFLAQAIESLLSQWPKPDEMIVVNDGCTDDTDRVVAPFLDRITYLKKDNGGKSSALNLGLRHQQSDYVWIFDDDDIALPGALAAHLDYLQTHPDCDFTYSSKYTFDGEFNATELAARPRPRLPAIPQAEFFVRSMESMHTMLQGMLISTRSLNAVGPFDETYHRSQDQEMLLRLARRFRGGYVDYPSFAMRIHGGSRGPADATHAAGQRAEVWETYRIKLFTDIRKKLTLAEYLPDANKSDAEMAPSTRRCALLQRACIMARNSLYAQATADIASARHLLGPGERFSTREQALLARTTQIDDMDVAPPYRFYWHLGRALPCRAEALRQPLVGLYWSLSREARSGQYGNVLRGCAAATMLCAAFVAAPRLCVPEQYS